MARRHQHSARVVTSFVRIPEELPEGKVRCNGCGKVVALSSVGRTLGHQTPAGEPCAYKVVYGERPALDELPAVNLPPQSKAESGRRSRIRRGDEVPSRLDAGSSCQDCGRWLPGERSLCGRCANHRTRARPARS